MNKPFQSFLFPFTSGLLLKTFQKGFWCKPPLLFHKQADHPQAIHYAEIKFQLLLLELLITLQTHAQNGAGRRGISTLFFHMQFSLLLKYFHLDYTSTQKHSKSFSFDNPPCSDEEKNTHTHNFIVPCNFLK